MSEAIKNAPSRLLAELSMHETLGNWSKGHTVGVLTELEYNPDLYPYQKIEVSEYGPLEPSVDYVRLGGVAMLREGFNNFTNEFRPHIESIENRLEQSRSMLIATPHIPDVLDTPIVAAAVFCASDNPTLAEKTIITTGKLMSRLSFLGVPAVEVMAKMGEVDMSIPRSDSAKTAGMETGIIDYVNQQMLYHFARKAREGRLIHNAPSNTRAARTYDGYLIPRVKEQTAKLITKFIGYGMPVVVRRPSQNEPAGWRLGEARNLTTADDVHAMMQEMADLSSALFGRVEYESVGEAESRLQH